MVNHIDVNEIKKKIQWHQEEASKLQNALDLLISNSKAEVNLLNWKEVLTETSHKHTSHFKTFIQTSTFKQVILALFADYLVPLTGRQIYESYKALTDKNIEYNSFSAQLSTLVSAKAIKKHTFTDNPIETKYYYGVPEWFEGESLNEKVLNTIIKKPETNQAPMFK